MDFQQLADVAEKWCSNTPFELIATEETERRMDFYADPGVSFYVLCPDNGCGDNFAGGRPARVERERGLPAFLAAGTGLHLLLRQEDAPGSLGKSLQVLQTFTGAPGCR
ncbi:maturin, neural progenitor differentiation regulator-like protein [Phyllostomus discolor]|uniref:Maturin n=1 Tax=Phyllostomus discolor TaxID=89673 RepID=A0A833Z4L1_9CHIR|nr:maturin, neural progenitor differentiation regulator-like protein [Phyllostomus discolor]